MHTIRKVNTKRRLNVEKDVLDYLRHTQFHGAKRLADGESSWYWVPSMLFLFICATVVICLTVKRFQENPTFMTQQESTNSMQKFPSVIICPEVEYNEFKIKEFLSSMTYPNDLNETYIRAVLPQLAALYSHDTFYKIRDLENLEKFLEHNDVDVETAGRQLTATCEETLIRCRWENLYYKCSDIFEMELTGDGFCCVFNGRSLRREMKEHMHHFKVLKRKRNWRTKSVGFHSGLILAINQSQTHLNIDLSYKWIALQSSQRFVDTSLNGTPLNPRSEQWIIYQTRSFYISNDAKDLEPSLRKCNLPDQALKYFPDYKRRYCILECEMANTIKLCNCVRVVHPKPHGVRYCGVKDHLCAIHAIVAYGSSCQCLATCSLDSSSITISSIGLDSSVEPIDRFYTGLNLERVTIVRVFIQSYEQWTYQRRSYYSYLELSSQLGGMFNVFFGCSILTMLGIIQIVWKVFVKVWKNFFVKVT